MLTVSLLVTKTGDRRSLVQVLTQEKQEGQLVGSSSTV